MELDIFLNEFMFRYNVVPSGNQDKMADAIIQAIAEAEAEKLH